MGATFLRDEAGQDLVEYSLLIALIVIAGVGLLQSAGGGFQNLWTTATSMLNSAQSAAS